MRQLGIVVKGYRDAAGLSHEVLAELLKEDAQYEGSRDRFQMSNYECGKVPPSRVFLTAFLNVIHSRLADKGIELDEQDTEHLLFIPGYLSQPTTVVSAPPQRDLCTTARYRRKPPAPSVAHRILDVRGPPAQRARSGSAQDQPNNNHHIHPNPRPNQHTQSPIQTTIGTKGRGASQPICENQRNLRFRQPHLPITPIRGPHY